MKSVGRAAVVFLAGLAVGCGGSGGEKATKNGHHQPKHPNVRVEVRDPSGMSGHSIWHEEDDGWFFQGHQSSGEGVSCSLKYEGTTDAGDEYVFNVRQGEAERSEEFVYAGKEMTVDAGDGVSILMKPRG